MNEAKEAKVRFDKNKISLELNTRNVFYVCLFQV
jgi:hypothetical protein